MAEVARITARAEAAERASMAAVLQVRPRYRSTALLLEGQVEEEALTFRLELGPLIGELEKAAFPAVQPQWPSLSVARGWTAAWRNGAVEALAEWPIKRGLLVYGARFARRLVSASATVAVAALAMILVVRLLADGAGGGPPSGPPVEGASEPTGESQVVDAEYSAYPLGSVEEENWDLPAGTSLEVSAVGNLRVLEITARDDREAVRICRTFPSVRGATIRASAGVLVSQLPDEDLTVLGLQGGSMATAALQFGADGFVAQRDGSRQVGVTEPYDSGTWYRVELVVNPDEATYSWRLTDRDAGTVITEGTGVGSWTPVEEIDAVCFETPTSPAGSALRIGWLRVLLER
jgi:hypothetical protein